MTTDTEQSYKGLIYGLQAYLIWGFFPVYFKLLRRIEPLEVVSHRIVWSVVFMLVMITCYNCWGGVKDAFYNKRVLLTLLASTLMITANWLTFIYAVAGGQLLQSSLGYFITPLVNVLLGVVFLGERLRRAQLLSLLFAVAGVVVLATHVGRTPWIAIILAFSMGLYGLLRKTVRVEPMAGLMVETLLTFPFALAYILWITVNGNAAFPEAIDKGALLLPLAGILTATPLILFSAAARTLKLSTMGFLQYITPSLQFALAVLIYKETFTSTHLITFSLIWIGLALYIIDAVRSFKSSKAYLVEKSETNK